MAIPFIDLKTQFSRIEQSVRSRMETVLQHGRFIMGPEVGELEERLAEFCGVRFAVGCSSGTDALLMALMAQGVGPGDLVFTTPFTFVATAEAIALAGAVPAFVDIDPDTYNLDPKALHRAAEAAQARDAALHPLPRQVLQAETPLRMRGVLAVDLFGFPADYEAINRVAEDFGMFVVEDAAQSFGATSHGRVAGALADAGCTSFFPAKPLGGFGDGGAVFTDDPDLDRELRSIRVHGQDRDKYSNRRIGLNARLDTLQAAVLLAKLDVFPQELESRQRIAAAYTELLQERAAGVCTPLVPKGMRPAWAQYSIRVKDRDGLRQALQASSVPTNVYYEIPLHLQPAFVHLGYGAGDMPVAEETSRHIVSLPMHPYLTLDQIRGIVDSVAGNV